jgi:hypothetical protein
MSTKLMAQFRRLRALQRRIVRLPTTKMRMISLEY